jgi:hypothetical protein
MAFVSAAIAGASRSPANIAVRPAAPTVACVLQRNCTRGSIGLTLSWPG